MELKSSILPLQGTKADILWSVVVFIFVFTVYILCPVTTSTDSRWIFYFSMRMLREQNADLDEYAHLMEGQDFRVIYLDDHIYSYFPLGVSIVSVPYVWAVDQVFDLRYSTDLATYLVNHFPDQRLAKIEKIAASFISALAAALFFMLVSPRLNRLNSILLALIFSFLTPMLSTASRALWQHGLSALILTLVLWILLQQPQKKWYFFSQVLCLGFPMLWNGKPISVVHAPERAWDMLDLQALRGTCEDKLEGPAPLCWFYSGESK